MSFSHSYVEADLKAKRTFKKFSRVGMWELTLEIVLMAGERWEVFEYEMRCIAIDLNSGLWIGPSGGQWTCIEKTCSVSSALEAAEFLTNALEDSKVETF